MKNRNTEKKQGILLELLLAVLLFAGMTAFRIVQLNGAAVTDGGFYELCKIKAGGGMPYLSYGLSDCYVKLLYAFFYLFGNHLAAAAYLELALQLAALVLFYFAVRGLWGFVPALAVEAALFVFPEFVDSLTKLNQGNFCLLLLCLELLLSAVLLKSASKSGCSGWFALSCLFYGMLAGMSVYLELLFAAVPFITLFLLLLLKRERPVKGMNRRSLQSLCYLLGVGGGFFACLSVKWMWGMQYPAVLQEYVQTQLTADWRPVYAGQYPSAILLAVLFFIAAAGFVGRSYEKREEQPEKKESIVVTEIESFEPAAAGEEQPGQKQANPEKPTEQPAQQDSRYLENPLPLPKKHVPKEMDYGFEPAECRMKYDVELSPGDDFDIT